MKYLHKIVQYRIEANQDDMQVRGNALASGDDALDKKEENHIIERLNNGDVWAWACVRVVAFIPGLDLEGDDYLGACSYKSEEDFIAENDYYQDMKANALLDLMLKIKSQKTKLSELMGE